MTAEAQPVDEVFGSSDISAGCPERFGKCAHKHVDGTRRYVEIIADTAAVRPNRSD